MLQHAKRQIHLGASLTLAMPRIIAMISVNTFGEPNVLRTEALVPEFEILEITDSDLASSGIFGKITIRSPSPMLRLWERNRRCN